MTVVLNDQARMLLRAPFEIDRARSRVGEALWLYVYLVSHAMKTGHVCRSRERIALEVDTEEVSVDRWMETLVDTRLVTIQSPAPYLVIKLRFWPGRGEQLGSNATETEPIATSQKAEQSNVPVGSSLLLPAGKASNAGRQGVDGGAGEGAGLLAEAQALLAPADLALLRKMLAKHPPHRIRDALSRVARTPPAQIRKSRFALFRYLLAQSPHSSSHDHDPPPQP